MTDITTAAELAARGFGPDEIARMARANKLIRVRRGAYTAEAGADARTQHRQLIEATVRQCAPEAVVSHLSAAVLHRLPILSSRLERVTLTRDRPGGGQVRQYVRVHGLPLAEPDIATLDGLRVTSLARTVLDLACSLPPERSVPIGDAALRAGLDPGELAAALARARHRHGVGSARRAIALLDARAETPGESLSRLLFHQHGLPAPVPQFEVRDAVGVRVARCDFGWDEQRTVGEFDGRIKYGRELQPRQDIEEVLFDEKRREDALRDLGWQVVRWVWADLREPAALLVRLERAFDRGRRSL